MISPLNYLFGIEIRAIYRKCIDISQLRREDAYSQKIF
jgi:hypothetical protein